MASGELLGTVALGPTLGTLPQVGADVCEGIKGRVDDADFTVTFSPLPETGYMLMPSRLSIQLNFTDDGIASRRTAMELLIEVHKTYST